MGWGGGRCPITDTHVVQNSKKLLFTNLGHLAEFFKVSSYQVEERQFVKVLCPLVSHFYNLLNNKLK